MALIARVFLAVLVFLFVVGFSMRINDKSNIKFKDFSSYAVLGFSRQNLSSKSWLKRVLSKKHRKSIRCSRSSWPSSLCLMMLNPYLEKSLMMAGDVESNPGPKPETAAQAKESQSLDPKEVMEAILSLKSDVSDLRSTMVENQKLILGRLGKMEKDIETVKAEVAELGKDQVILKDEVEVLKDEVSFNGSKGLDLSFTLDRLEQYTRKNSVRAYDIPEEEGEHLQEKMLKVLNDELNVKLNSNDIDIIHRVGRFSPGKPRAVLIKFMSHKSKELVMRNKRKATGVKFREDLATNVKKAFDHISINRRNYNVESVWTIDGRIKYKLNGNPRSFEIRSYADYHELTHPHAPTSQE